MTVLLVALGGAIGSVARHTVRELASRRGRPELGTLTVNVLGAAALGLVVSADLAGWVDALLATGALGAFTTMSTLALDAVRLGEEQGSWLRTIGYVTVTLVAGLTAATTVTL